MKEIKFRAWDNGAKMYQTMAPMMNIHTGEISDLPGRFILEQFTGIREHNIGHWYHNDIITDGNKTYLIDWSDTELTWILSNPTMRGTIRLSDINSRLWHRIGNIHESPELLTGHDKVKS